MRSFESFKAKRERMDPSSRKLSDSQWQQAYAAYKRVRGYAEEDTPEAEVEGVAKSVEGAVRRMHAHPEIVAQLRSSTAYPNERRLIDIVYVVALIVIGLLLLVQLYSAFTATQMVREMSDEMGGGMRTVTVIQWGALVSAMIGSAFKLAVVYLGRSLLHIFIDIADKTLRSPMQDQNEL